MSFLYFKLIIFYVDTYNLHSHTRCTEQPPISLPPGQCPPGHFLCNVTNDCVYQEWRCDSHEVLWVGAEGACVCVRSSGRVLGVVRVWWSEIRLYLLKQIIKNHI